jgi:hypothetical protein
MGILKDRRGTLAMIKVMKRKADSDGKPTVFKLLFSFQIAFL